MGISIITLIATNPTASAQNIIFENGPPVPFGQQVAVCSFQNDVICADDFTFADPETITDFHFWILENPSFDDIVFYTIYHDDNGAPGAPVIGGSGQGIIQDVTADGLGIGCATCFQVSMDLPIAVDLSPGTYWIGVSGNGNDTWLIVTSDEPGNAAWTNDGGNNWNFFQSQEIPFALTGPILVAGEMIPVDATSLLVSGIQTNLSWMIPAVVIAAGVSAFLIRKN